jgi:RimJ/RimL family protein N-acetyltransferase
MSEPIFREGHVVKLVRYGPEHAEKAAEWYYGFEYRFFFRDFTDPLDMEAIKNLHISMGRSGYHLLTILDKVTGAPIGLMTYILEKPNARIFKFGIMLDANCQRKTWAIDAINVLGDYLFNKCFAHKLTVEFADTDKQIHRITAQGGFTHDATLKEELFIDGKYIDEVRYSLHIDKYEELYSNFLP